MKMENTLFHNNKAISVGGAIYCDKSNVTLENSIFINHSSLQGGVLGMGEGSLMANNTVFTNNIVNGTGSGAAISKSSSGRITLENCILSMNTALGGAIWQYYFDDSIIRLSKVDCTSCKSCGPCWYFVLHRGANLTMYTWMSEINIENVEVSSTNSTFLNQSIAHNMINTEGDIMHWHELPFASGKLL